MRVVHVETGLHLYGGAQQVIYLSKGLLERGIDSIIVCPPESAINTLARYQHLPVRNIVCHGDLDLIFAFRLRACLGDERPDIVHCHSRRGADFFGGRAALMAGVPAVLSRRVDSRDSGFIAERRYSPFRKIVAISNNVATKLCASGVDPESIVTIRSAVDVAALRPSLDRAGWLHEFNLRDDHVVAVITAQFIKRKGHRYVLEALPELCISHPNFRLILFGKGPLEPELRNVVTRLGIENQVQFAGFRDDLDRMLGCADLLIHPALEEGLGVAMLKAAAAGLPVVAFDVAGAQEVVVQGQTGLLVPAAQGTSMLQAVAYLIDNRAERERLGSTAKARMRDLFSVNEMVDKHIILYQAIIDE